MGRVISMSCFISDSKNASQISGRISFRCAFKEGYGTDGTFGIGGHGVNSVHGSGGGGGYYLGGGGGFCQACVGSG